MTRAEIKDLAQADIMRLMDADALLSCGRLPFDAAMLQADRESPRTRADVADRLKMDKSVIDRSFSFNPDDAPYFVRADKLPELALAMDTDAVIRWLVGRWLYLRATGGLAPRRSVSVMTVYHRMAEIAREYGEVAGKIEEYTSADSEDGRNLSKSELRRLAKENGDVIARAIELQKDLRLMLGELVEREG